MAINDILNNVTLTLAATVVAAGMSGCTTTRALAPGQSFGQSGASAALQSADRRSAESPDEYNRRMQEMRNAQVGMSWTSGGYVPNEDRTRYSGVAERDVRRYDTDYNHSPK